MDFTTAQWAIILSLGAALFIFGHLARKYDKDLQQRIADKHPDEWKRVSAEKMGMKGDVMRATLIDESIKSGILKQQADCKTMSLHKRSKLFRFLSPVCLMTVITFVVSTL